MFISFSPGRRNGPAGGFAVLSRGEILKSRCRTQRTVTSSPAQKSSAEEPVLQGTGTSVRAVVELWRGATPAEEITLDSPHLTLAQVFDALEPLLRPHGRDKPAHRS